MAEPFDESFFIISFMSLKPFSLSTLHNRLLSAIATIAEFAFQSRFKIVSTCAFFSSSEN